MYMYDISMDVHLPPPVDLETIVFLLAAILLMVIGVCKVLRENRQKVLYIFGTPLL